MMKKMNCGQIDDGNVKETYGVILCWWKAERRRLSKTCDRILLVLVAVDFFSSFGEVWRKHITGIVNRLQL